MDLWVGTCIYANMIHHLYSLHASQRRKLRLLSLRRENRQFEAYQADEFLFVSWQTVWWCCSGGGTVADFCSSCSAWTPGFDTYYILLNLPLSLSLSPSCSFIRPTYFFLAFCTPIPSAPSCILTVVGLLCCSIVKTTHLHGVQTGIPLKIREDMHR